MKLTTAYEEFSPATQLGLEPGSIDPAQLSIGSLMHEINQQNKPAWLLRLLMNSLEKRRMEKGLGWSRPWNKYGLTIFRVHRHRGEFEGRLFTAFDKALSLILPELPLEYQIFARTLLQDPLRMAFTFYHNQRNLDGDFEGFTLSIGRKVAADRTKRDRLDIILEDKKTATGVDGQYDHLRLYVNPWDEKNIGKYFLWEQNRSDSGNNFEYFQELYQEGIQFYNQAKNIPDLQWNHWANRYIDYFGARQFIPVGSQFL